MTILNRLLQSLQKIKCSALDLIKCTLAAQRTLALSILSSGLVTMASSIHASPLLRITEVMSAGGLGTNILTVSGTDATFFEITNGSLYIKAGSILDFETKTSYSLTVNVDDPTLGSTPDLTTNFSLAVTDVVNETTLPALIISEVAPWSSTSGLGLNADCIKRG